MIYLLCMMIQATSVSPQDSPNPVLALTLAERNADIWLGVHLNSEYEIASKKRTELISEITRRARAKYRRVSIRPEGPLTGEAQREEARTLNEVSLRPEANGFLFRIPKRRTGPDTDVHVLSDRTFLGWLKDLLGFGRYEEIARDPEGFRLRASLASGRNPASGRMLGSLASCERGDRLIEIYQDALIAQKKGDLRSAARRYETILAEMGKGRADILDRVLKNWSVIQSYRQESD